MLIRSLARWQSKGSEITPERIYLNRRAFMRASVALAATSLVHRAGAVPEELVYRESEAVADSLTPLKDVTHYNNFYEFGTDKLDPARYAEKLTTDPWAISIQGEVERPGSYGFEDILAGVALEERIYRLRCVEAWSMVIPWIGFPLSTLLKRVGLNSRSKFVAFETLYRPSEMRGQRSATALIDWPYQEGLRIDEAMHPLTILAVGLYGKELPNQNGAPIRLVVPWKYGFKSIKSIVGIRLQEKAPATTWNQLAPDEYGFFANVNPNVDHPRWSQKMERRLPSTLFSPNRVETLMFNGYGDEVAALYAGLDLRRFY